jgi:putative aldouronate transport system substrate-binding protein
VATGAQGSYWYGSGALGITAIKKASEERVKEILRVMNFLAAPFGSEEFLLLNYGVKGVDYELDDQGNPKLTTRGQADVMPWNNAATGTTPVGPRVLYNAQDSDFARVIQPGLKSMVAQGVEDPSVGLYSDTNTAKFSQLNMMMIDGLSQIVTGAQPFTALDSLVADWRKNGGDQSRSEFEQALAAQH